MINHITDQKQNLRKVLKGRLSLMQKSDKIAEDIKINSTLQKKFKNTLSILCYFPLGSEPNIIPSIKYWLDKDFIISIPRIYNGDFQCLQIDNFSKSNFIRSSFGTLEPNPHTSNTISKMNVDLVLVPGLAFTSNGLRLGRGGGIYDKFLSTLSNEKSLTVGICYKNQIVDSIPIEKHDRSVDLVISIK